MALEITSCNFEHFEIIVTCFFKGFNTKHVNPTFVFVMNAIHLQKQILTRYNNNYFWKGLKKKLFHRRFQHDKLATMQMHKQT